MTTIRVFGVPMYLKKLRAPRFKFGFTLMPLLPWDKKRDHLAGLRPAQKKAVAAFTVAASATAKMNLADRMTIIGAALRGKDFGGKKLPYPYARLSPAALKTAIARVKALV